VYLTVPLTSGYGHISRKYSSPGIPPCREKGQLEGYAVTGKTGKPAQRGGMKNPLKARLG
jgi:hypothetical protein